MSANQTIGTLLTQLGQRKNNANVLIIASTNHKDQLDPALIRPGRFDSLIPVELPDLQARKEIFKHYSRRYKLDMRCTQTQNQQLLIKTMINDDDMAQQTAGFSGADIKELCTKAARGAAREKRPRIKNNDFNNALRLMNQDRKKEHEVPFGMYC